MISARHLIAIFVFFATTSISVAYERNTHRGLSTVAAQSSILQTDPNILNSLGLKDSDKFNNSKNQERTVFGLIEDGADFEDNNIRSLFHFFDPLNDEGLLFFTSPTWSLEDKGKIHLLQKYSFSDARNAFYEALTVTSEDQRKTKFGKAFESLGRVIHHIHDMAQPQHVRSDTHLNFDNVDWKWIENPSRYESYTNIQKEKDKLPFDGYPPINSKDDTNFLTTARAFWHAENKNPATGKGIAEFTNINFVSAGTNFRGAFQNGGIIAQSNARYVLPAPSSATPSFELANDLLGPDTPAECSPPNSPCVMAFFSSTVTDNYRPQAGGINPKASTASIFDQDLQFYGKTVSYPNLDKCVDPNNPDTCEKIETGQIFALNDFNFDAAHEFLIPRAVAYSAGLIDYFFRGRLAAQDANYTDQGIELRVRNAIDVRQTPAWKDETLKSGGSLVLAYEYKPANAAPVVGASVPVTLTEDLKPGKTSLQMYSFTIPEIPDNATEVKYRLVYRGQLGQEDDAVAVGQVEPVSGFLVTPSSTPPDGIPGRRLIYRAWGKWHLGKQIGLRAGNIDWKGDYVNGRPTKTLTWEGPPARYFPLIRGYPFTEEIYRHGKVYAVAPLPVLGAAITRDAQGDSWLIVVGSDGMRDVVYRRPDKASTSPALRDPQTNPEGWEAIGSYTGGTGYREANRPWFFNASGTQAATLREIEIEQDSTVVRNSVKTVTLELTLEGASATIAPRGNGTGWNRTITETIDIAGQPDNYTGVATSTREGSGGYVVAVDYSGDQQVTCEMRLEESYNGITRANTNVISDSNQHGYFRQILQCGETVQDFWNEQVVGSYSPDTRARDYRLKYVAIEYTDARYGLIVTGEREITQKDSCSNQSAQSEGSYSERDIIAYGNRRFTVFSFEESNIGTACNLPVPSLPYGGSYSDTRQERTYPYLYAGLSLTDGDWLIDRHETLLASQTRGANHYNPDTGYGTGEFYNQLDGADIDALLGGAAPRTSYFPTWVVH